MDDSKNKSVTASLSEKEIRRYALQIAIPFIGIDGQQKLKSAKVLVVGAGGKGTSVLQNLSTIGVGMLGISDNCPVEESSLSRQYLYGNSDLGKQKAIISKQKLQEINHLVKYELHNVYLSRENILAISRPYDILVDTTDNFTARYLINDAAITLNKPLVFCQTLNGEGLVSVFNYRNGPSLRCLYPEPVVAEESVSGKQFSCHVALMSMLGAITANEVSKIILDQETVLSGKVLRINAAEYSFSTSGIIKKPKNFNIPFD
jgi:adenylyltransferase/sulfurtransferase